MSLDKINIYMIKPGTATFDDFLKGNDATELTLPSNAEGQMCFRRHGGRIKTQETIPWLAFINTALEEDEKVEFQSSNRFPCAVVALKVPVGDNNEFQFFAITFGVGAEGIIEKERTVKDFGIKVGMNICDPDKLKRVQTTSHESVTTQTERQVSAGTNIGFLNIDDEKEFLKTLSGSSKDQYADISSFKGKESIALKFSKEAVLDWDYIVEFAKELYDLYGSDEYKTVFKSYDKFHLEIDPLKIAALDSRLFERIRTGNFEHIHLAPPEFFDYDRYSFRYSKSNDAEKFEELVIDDLIRAKRRFSESSSINTLKGWKIYKHDSETDSTYESGWSAYQCIVAEIHDTNETYILSNGQWKVASPDFEQEITSYLNDLEICEEGFLGNDVNIWCDVRNQNREEVYNAEVARNCPALYLFDKANIDIAGESRYEICDLLHSDKIFVHVKRFRSGAASISHLFSQARFYADAFILDDRCRPSMRDFINEDESDANNGKDKQAFIDIIPEDRQEIVTANYTVVFCVLSERANFEANSLPFMAKYELMKAHKYLTRDKGYRCRIATRIVTLENDA